MDRIARPTPYRFPVHISLNPMFHSNRRHLYNWNGLKSEFPI